MGKKRKPQLPRRATAKADSSPRWVTPQLWLLLALAILPFLPSLGAEFTIDDHPLIEENPYLRAFSWELFKDARWLRTLSLMLDASLFGLEPFGFHVQNIALHAVATLLTFRMLQRLALPVNAAFLGAAVFALHPSHIEVITNIANRKESLCYVFSMASLLVYFRFLRLPDGRERWTSLLWTFLLGGLALASKQVAIALPLVAIAYEALFVVPERRFLLRSPLVLGGVLAACLIGFAGYVQLEMGWARLLEYRTVQGFEGDPSSLEILLVAPVAFWRYVELLLLPARLCPDHVLLASSLAYSPVTIAAWLVLAGWIYLAVRLGTRARCVSFAMWWIFLHWLPVSNLFPSAAALADRYLYILSFGLSLGVASLWSGAAHKLPAAFRSARLRNALAVGFCACLLAGSIQYNQIWMTEEKLWRHAVTCEPESFRARVNVGSYDYLKGNYTGARLHFEKAVAIRSDNARALYNLGNAYRRLRRYREAENAYRKAADLGLKSAEQQLRNLSSPSDNATVGPGFSRHLSGDRDT